MYTQDRLRRALATSSTSTGFTAKVPTSTEPTGAGIFDLYDEELGIAKCGRIPRWILLMPFGTDGSNDTFSFRLWGWTQVTCNTVNLTGDQNLWVPQLLAEIAVVLGNISFTLIATSHFMADTLTLSKGYTGPVNSPANDTPGQIMVDLLGNRKIEFDWDLAGAQEGVAMNCYWRMVDDNENRSDTR